MRHLLIFITTMLAKVNDAFQYIMVEGDRRTFELLLTNPWWPLFTFFVYVFMVKVMGPMFMKNRAPYTLKKTLMVYNAFQVALSAYMFAMFSQHGWWSVSNWFKCKPIEETSSPAFDHLLDAHHLYYISKYTELFDTVFFVLRKKSSQVTFLHVYHHGTMPFFTCLTMRFSPGSSVSFIGFLNTLVHVVMYGYYLLAAMGPHVQRYLWWKRYITTMQLIQFVTLFLHFILVLGSSCNVPKGISTFLALNIAFNFALFYHFYRREYLQKIKAKSSQAEEPNKKTESILNSSLNKSNGTSSMKNNLIRTENGRHRGRSLATFASS